MAVKNNLVINYKDMTPTYGIIRGLQFVSFVTQYFGPQSARLGSLAFIENGQPPLMSNDFLMSPTKSPIRSNSRDDERVHILFRFTAEEDRDPALPDWASRFQQLKYLRLQHKKCWPHDAWMRLMKHDVHLSRIISWDIIKNRLPRSVSTIQWDGSFVSVYSKDNPNLLFNMVESECRILPNCRMTNEEFTHRDDVWNLQNEITKKKAVDSRRYE